MKKVLKIIFNITILIMLFILIGQLFVGNFSFGIFLGIFGVIIWGILVNRLP
jgi:hypothetical protein